jgi:hypothetical protein
MSHKRWVIPWPPERPSASEGGLCSEERFSPSCKINRGACSLIALMMEAGSTSQTSVNFYQATRRNNPENSHLHTRRPENLRSHLVKTFPVIRRGTQRFMFSEPANGPYLDPRPNNYVFNSTTLVQCKYCTSGPPQTQNFTTTLVLNLLLGWW